jgi:hypothetical protein
MPPFLFHAEYEGGYSYHQTPMDQSQQNPSKSAFYDIRVAPIMPEEKLVRFGLVRLRLRPILAVAVDLRTGTFSINGTAVTTPASAPRKREGIPLRLVYEKLNELRLDTQARKVSYRIGWRCGDDWLALDLQAEPESIIWNGTHNTRPELSPILVG